MSISMHQASVPVLARTLNNLIHILEKAAAHVEAKKLDASVLLNSRLFPDMFALTRQVQIATDMAKGCVARLAGDEPVKLEDGETTFADLIARVRKVIGIVEGYKPAQIDGSETRDVVLKSPRGDMNFKGQAYLQGFVLPNVYFHVTTTYNILRHNGVELGKMDFIGQP
ncbi:DUF1993 domain-containing protein [Stenotrophobium rhamnosiphilum]|uniref:DUF1993 domain-containing protein n=1 Tax=Stenotrophobium rhamnosiphilum TaxID=2029166 RepID=A0A2T5MGD5_9GAMM|nr:DUF1993 domain-containing protein [Stenotrophobium rhamnosiphilum]PTU31645.1 DUF1993 domain-containing protein [Stenotrophobium rhamnosiphilum]